MQCSLIKTETSSVETLRQYAASGMLFAILDACDEPAVPQKISELGDVRAVSLYRGGAEEDYSAIAPYLVQVDSALLDWIVAALWEHPWGIFAVSPANLETLRTHFRKFLIVQMPDTEKFYFRYYDPRVLKSFLPTCSEAELAEFLGPVQAYAGGEPGTETVRLWSK